MLQTQTTLSSSFSELSALGRISCRELSSFPDEIEQDTSQVEVAQEGDILQSIMTTFFLCIIYSG